MSLFSDINGFSAKDVKISSQKYDREDFSEVDFCVNNPFEDTSDIFDFSATDVNFAKFNEEKDVAIDEFKYNFEILELDDNNSFLDFEG